MKKSNIRNFLFLLLTLLSILSYTYMCIASTTTTDAPIKTSQIEVETSEIEAEKNIYLPDVVLIQKVLKTGKQVVDKAL